MYNNEMINRQQIKRQKLDLGKDFCKVINSVKTGQKIEREKTHHKFTNIRNGIKISLQPGQVVQLVRASSQCAKAVGSIPSQGTYKNQAINA